MTERLAGKVIPEHIAIILDGNGRWAAERSLPRAMGHKAGCEAVEQTVRDCAALGVKYLTVYGFRRKTGNVPPKKSVHSCTSFACT